MFKQAVSWIRRMAQQTRKVLCVPFVAVAAPFRGPWVRRTARRTWIRLWAPFVAFAATVRQAGFATKRFFRRLGRAVAGWWRQLNHGELLRGLPALLALLCGGVLAVCCWQQSSAALVVRYQKKAAAALEAQDYRTAQTCYERLVVLAERDPEYLWGLFQAANAAGERVRAAALLDELAPVDQQGYGLAHLLTAQHLLTQPKATAEDRRIAEIHLLWAANVLPKSVETQFQLGRLYANAGKPDLAEPHLLLRDGAASRIPLVPGLALFPPRGCTTRLRNTPARRQNYYQALVGNGPDNQLYRIPWAEAKRLLDDYPAAVAILERGLELTRNPVFKKALGQLYVAWFEQKSQNRKTSLVVHLALLERAWPTTTRT